MLLKKGIHMLLALAVSLSLQMAGALAPPDIKNFTPILSKELEFRVDDYKTAFVGRVVVYQNPDDPNEFVRVYYRQVAIVSERAKEKNVSETGDRDTNFSNLKYHSQDETEVLGRVQQATDVFVYVQWRTVRDPRTGRDIRDGFFRSWLLEQNGNWTFAYGYNPDTSPFSEPSKDNPKKRINVGIKFTLNGAVHIVRIDQDDISVSVEEAANEKK